MTRFKPRPPCVWRHQPHPLLHPWRNLSIHQSWRERRVLLDICMPLPTCSIPLPAKLRATASDFPCQCQGYSMPLLVIFHATVDDVLCHCQESSVPLPAVLCHSQQFYAFCVWDRADVFTTVAKNVTLICVCKFICWTLSCCFTFSV